MSSHRRPGGLAAALEEERLELAAELRNSTANRTTTTYAPQRRSILDTATGPSPGFVAPRHGSIAGIGVGVTPPAGRGYQDSPPTSPPAVPTMNNDPNETPSSSASSASSTPSTTPVTTPKTPYTSLKTAPPPLKRPDPPASNDKEKNGDKKPGSPETRRLSIRWDSGVDMPPSANGRRFGPPQEKAPRALPGKNAMAAVMSGFDLKVGLPSFSRGRDSSRNATKRGTSLDSHLPTLGRRAQSGSPARRLPNSNLRTAASDAPKSQTDKTKESKVESSDEKLLRPPAIRHGSSETDVKGSASGDERLYDSDNNASESSEEEDELSSSDDEAGSENNSEDVKRGRMKEAEPDSSSSGETSEDSKPASDETGM